MMHFKGLNINRASLQMLLFNRQIGLRNVKTIGGYMLQSLFSGNTSLYAVMNIKFNASGFTMTSERLCYVKNFQGILCLCIFKFLTSQTTELKPMCSIPLNNLNAHEKIVEVMILDGPYPNFSEDLPPEDLEPVILILKLTCLFRNHADTGVAISKHDFSFTGAKMSGWDTCEEQDWIIIRSTKEAPPGFDALMRVVLIVFQLHPFKYLCSFYVSEKSFVNPNVKLYGKIGLSSSIELYSTFLSVSTSNGYTLLYNFRDQALSSLHCMDIVLESNPLTCLLVFPGKFPLMSIESHSMTSTVLYGNEPHSMFLTPVHELIDFMNNYGLSAVTFSDRSQQVASITQATHYTSMKKQTARKERESMLLACGKFLKWEEQSCNYICSCTAEFMPGDFNRIVLREPGSLRIYQLPFRDEKAVDTPLLDNLLLRCGLPPADHTVRAEEFSQSGRLIKRPPSYRRFHILSQYYVSYSCDCNLLLILELQKKGIEILLKTIFFYDVFSLELLRELDLCLFVKLDGQDPSSVEISLTCGILLIDIVVEHNHHIIGLQIGSISDNSNKLDLNKKFNQQAFHGSDGRDLS